ncbi:TPA: hypothetical protein ACH3X1_009786 [Trebouxia sp. C0004]
MVDTAVANDSRKYTDIQSLITKVDMEGKVAIVTGGNTGLGFEICKSLASCGAHVILATRNDKRGLESISNFVTAFHKKKLPLHVLANNAAVWMVEDQMTEDGFEAQIGTHYFGHAYLTSLLLPTLKKSTPSRVVWTTSAAETSGDVDWDNLPGVGYKSDFMTYCTNKLYGLMFARELATRLKDTGVNVYAGQPGMASTDFFNPKKFDILKISAVAQYLAQKVIGLTPAQGAAPVIMCCLMAPDELIDTSSGTSYGPKYYKTWLPRGLPNITNVDILAHQKPENDAANDPEACSRLYDQTLHIIRKRVGEIETEQKAQKGGAKKPEE